jgi:ABC-2 type transport system ATP-binding protein
MSEMALTADHVIVIGKGRLLAESSVDDLIQHSSQNFVRVRSLQNDKLATMISTQGGSSRLEADGALAVTGISASAIGDVAAAKGVALHELSPQEASLEEAYMELTRDSVEYRAGVPGLGAPPREPARAKEPVSAGKVA